MCRDHRYLSICQKQHRQNEPAVQVDVTAWSGRHSYWWRSSVMGIPDMCRDHRCLMMPVKNNTDRMNQLVR